MTGPVRYLELDRPATSNLLTVAWREELADQLDAHADDESAKVVVVRSSGPVFCAGSDPADYERATADAAYGRRLWAASDRFHHALLGCPLPTVAAVDGPAMAAGFDLAMACDLRVASVRARFARPDAAWGIPVYGVVADLVGGAIARELVFTDRVLDAEEALALHLVHRVTEPADLAAEVDHVVAGLVARDRADLVATKAKVIRHTGLAAPRSLEL